MPDGMEILICHNAIEKPKAMITKKALIFLLETFLKVLVKTLKSITVQVYSRFDPKRLELLKSFLELDPN
jgi:hypothetical protein